MAAGLLMNRADDLRDAGNVDGFIVNDQGILGQQFLAADGLFLGEKIVIDVEVVLLDLGEEFFEVFDFVKLGVFLQALPLGLAVGPLGIGNRSLSRGRGFGGFVDPEALLFEIFIALG